MEVLMISFILYLSVCGLELMLRVAKLISHNYLKLTSLGKKYINTSSQI